MTALSTCHPALGHDRYKSGSPDKMTCRIGQCRRDMSMTRRQYEEELRGWLSAREFSDSVRKNGQAERDDDTQEAIRMGDGRREEEARAAARARTSCEGRGALDCRATMLSSMVARMEKEVEAAPPPVSDVSPPFSTSSGPPGCVNMCDVARLRQRFWEGNRAAPRPLWSVESRQQPTGAMAAGPIRPELRRRFQHAGPLGAPMQSYLGIERGRLATLPAWWKHPGGWE